MIYALRKEAADSLRGDDDFVAWPRRPELRDDEEDDDDEDDYDVCTDLFSPYNCYCFVVIIFCYVFHRLKLVKMRRNQQFKCCFSVQPW